MASTVARFGRVINNINVLSRMMRYPHQLQCHRHFHKTLSPYATTEIMMPSLSPTMEEGTIIKWLKKEGDQVNPGDILCEVQTDKAVVSFDIEEEGVLAKILKPDNSADIKVGTTIALMVEEGEDWENVEVPAQVSAPGSESAAPPAPTPPAPAPSAPATSPSAAVTPAPDQDLHAAGIGPSVRKLTEEYGVGLSEITGTGPHNRLTKGDVLTHIKARNLQRQDLSSLPVPAPVSTPTTEQVAATKPPADKEYKTQYIPDIEGEEFVDIPNSGMRNTIAKRLTLSKTTIPHSYMTMSCNVAPVTRLRKELAGKNVKVSVNDFIVKSAAMALQRVPQVNSVLENDSIVSRLNVDVCVAVATQNGLITPIVQNAAQLGVDEISANIKDLADRARQNKLQLHEFQGGTFTISNLGMFGITEFSAVINPPQTAIMAVGSSRLALGPDGKPQSHMTVTLCYDVRAIDDTDATRFLDIFKDNLENPEIALSGSSTLKQSSENVFG